jgi:hypothetical protein
MLNFNLHSVRPNENREDFPPTLVSSDYLTSPDDGLPRSPIENREIQELISDDDSKSLHFGFFTYFCNVTRFHKTEVLEMVVCCE